MSTFEYILFVCMLVTSVSCGNSMTNDHMSWSMRVSGMPDPPNFGESIRNRINQQREEEDEKNYQELREAFFKKHPKLRNPAYCALTGPNDVLPRPSKDFDGDVFISHGEQCWDGNRFAGDGCSPMCRREICGNGVVDSGEECDDGNDKKGDGCSPICRREFCGNGVVDPGEECDENSEYCKECKWMLSDAKLTVLKLYRYFIHLLEFAKESNLFCGDFVIQASLGEQCDDGNNLDNDGCNSYCQHEYCGDGILQTGEQCDDGNEVNGDGCSASCKLEKR